VSDADQAEQELLALGATRIPGERETGFRVFADPAGHPFCIVFGRHSRAEPGSRTPAMKAHARDTSSGVLC